MSKKRGSKPQHPQKARRTADNARTDHLVRLAEGWDSRSLHDYAAKYGIGQADRTRIQAVTKRKTQPKKARKDRS